VLCTIAPTPLKSAGFWQTAADWLRCHKCVGSRQELEQTNFWTYGGQGIVDAWW
jgi:hypothetical protein